VQLKEKQPAQVLARLWDRKSHEVFTRKEREGHPKKRKERRGRNKTGGERQKGVKKEQ